MRHAALNLATALLSLSTAALAAGDVQGSLARARALFAKVDVDGDGLLSALEAGRNRIPSKDFVVYDADRDRKLSRAEFTLFYRQLLVKAGRDVGDDLDAEAARIEAGRRAQKAEQDKRIEEARQKALEGARRAEKAREDLGAGEAVEAAARTQAAREEQQRRAEAAREAARGSGEVVSPPPVQDDEAARIARARADKQAEDAARASAARLAKQREDAARAEQARLERQRRDALRVEQARAEKQAADAARAQEARQQDALGQGTPAERRAAGYVKRLVDGGRLSPAQARAFYTVLTARPRGAAGALSADEVRDAHGAARKRISALIVSGALSSEEGRQLAAALDARAKAALPPAPGGGPDARRGVATGRSGESSKPREAHAREARQGQGSERGTAGPDAKRRAGDGSGGTQRVGPVKDAGTRRAKKGAVEKDTVEKDTVEKDTVEKNTVERNTVERNTVRRDG